MRTVEEPGEGIDRGTGVILTDGGEDDSDESDESEASDDNGGSDESDASDDNGESDESEASDDSETDQAEEETEEASDESDDDLHEESGGEGSRVLYLDLEGLFLDLLGLEVDLSEVELDVSAVEGDGRLLGNLLSAISSLLDSAELLDAGIDDLLGGLVPEGEEGEDGENAISEAAGSARSAIGDAAEDLPVDEMMSEIAAEVVRQLLGGESDGQEGDGGTAEASG